MEDNTRVNCWRSNPNLFLNISDRCTGSALLLAVLWVLCSMILFCSHVCVASPKELPRSKAANPLKLKASRTHRASPSSSKHKLYKQSGKVGLLALLSSHFTESIHAPWYRYYRCTRFILLAASRAWVC